MKGKPIGNLVTCIIVSLVLVCASMTVDSSSAFALTERAKSLEAFCSVFCDEFMVAGSNKV